MLGTQGEARIRPAVTREQPHGRRDKLRRFPLVPRQPPRTQRHRRASLAAVHARGSTPRPRPRQSPAVPPRTAATASYACTPPRQPRGSPRAMIDSSTASIDRCTEPVRTATIWATLVFLTPGTPEITARCPVTPLSAG